MTDIERIVWGGIAGILVYTVGQLLSKFFIEPLYELRKVIGETRYNISFHASCIHTPISRTEDKSTAAQHALLKSSCELVAKLHAVPCYKLARFITFCSLPDRKSIEKAAVQLRGLSTYMHENDETADSNIDVVNKQVASIESLLLFKKLE